MLKTSLHSWREGCIKVLLSLCVKHTVRNTSEMKWQKVGHASEFGLVPMLLLHRPEALVRSAIHELAAKADEFADGAFYSLGSQAGT